MSAYSNKPARFLTKIHENSIAPQRRTYCAGFELESWRCDGLADHLISWLPEFALPEEELNITHANAYVKLKQAAIRVYTSEKYNKRGEAGEIALHAICRDFFGTIPISSRVFYTSSSNEVIKSFDLVHAKIYGDGKTKVWLGESKLYTDRKEAIRDAISSITEHIDRGFLKNQKLLLGPQIPKSTPEYSKIVSLFSSTTSIDALLNSAVFVVGIFADGDAAKEASCSNAEYITGCAEECDALAATLRDNGITQKIRIMLIYVPLKSKSDLVASFDGKLKGLQR